MSVDERIDLLKSKILHYTQDLLRFETVEIRLLDKSTRSNWSRCWRSAWIPAPPSRCCGPTRRATA